MGKNFLVNAVLHLNKTIQYSDIYSDSLDDHYARVPGDEGNDMRTSFPGERSSAVVHDLCTIPHDQSETILLRLASGSVDLIFSNPPYNIGKEHKRSMVAYLAQMRPIVEECQHVLSDHEPMCWQLGNYVHAGEMLALEFIPMLRALGTKMRNRAIWSFRFKSRVVGLRNTWQASAIHSQR
ncbi:hypothetical protein LJR030_002866 [Rhizobium sp. LjRoot30]|uniref:DNA methyltransferase n=1 Tax=Rhizobium sp. LjRoot30 TaxID=3342320 RepID=UPI003ECE919C